MKAVRRCSHSHWMIRCVEWFDYPFYCPLEAILECYTCFLDCPSWTMSALLAWKCWGLGVLSLFWHVPMNPSSFKAVSNRRCPSDFVSHNDRLYGLKSSSRIVDNRILYAWILSTCCLHFSIYQRLYIGKSISLIKSFASFCRLAIKPEISRRHTKIRSEQTS